MHSSLPQLCNGKGTREGNAPLCRPPSHLLQVWQIFVGTKARREEGKYDSMLEDVHREDAEDPNSSLAEIYARIRDRDPNNSFAVQIEKVRLSRDWQHGALGIGADVCVSP